MKRAVVAVCMLAIIIAGSITAILVIKKENSKLISILDEIQLCCENDDMEGAAQKAGQLEELWYIYERRMSVIVKDERLKELNTTIVKIRPYSEEANDELEAEIQNIRRQLGLIYKSELPTLFNIL